MPSGGSAKELHPPWAKLSSLGPKGPWDDNIALGGCNSFALPPEGMQLPIATEVYVINSELLMNTKKLVKPNL